MLTPVVLAQTTASPTADPTTSGPTSAGSTSTGATQGPTVLRPSLFQRREEAALERARLRRGEPYVAERATPTAAPTVARRSEFEVFVQRLAGGDTPVRRFGSDLMSPADEDDTYAASPVPSDYIVKPGDEIELAIWGSVDAELLVRVDRTGRITVPRVGTVQVAGARYGDLEKLIANRVGRVFKNFQIAVTLGQLRGVRVYVTGHVARPGAYGVAALSTLTQALMRAGGPSVSGSFRGIQLRRGGQTLANLDLYDLLLKGERGTDRVIEADDVIHVGPVGREVALVGSVNRPAIFELLPNETLADLLQMGGGFSAVADRKRLAIERLDERSDKRVVQLDLPASAPAPLTSGDVVSAFSAVETAQPVERQNKRVRIEGEVQRPGDYVLPPRSTVAEALQAAGGYSSFAFPFGTEFMRESVRVTQQQNYERALRDLETDLARYNNSQRTITADEAAGQNARSAATTRLIERLRAVKPNGRVVLQLNADARELPNLLLEDGDRLYIPPRPTSVGVFGSVYNGGSYLHSDGRQVEDFVSLAGGPTRGADRESAVVIRATGSVVSGREQGGQGGWFSRGSGLAGVPAQPGDTIFMPEELDKTTFIQHAKDWGLIVSQFGLGIAAILAITK